MEAKKQVSNIQRRHKSVANRNASERCDVIDLEMFDDISPMDLDRPWTDAQFMRDFLVVLAQREQLHDHTLTRRQLGETNRFNLAGTADDELAGSQVSLFQLLFCERQRLERVPHLFSYKNLLRHNPTG